jgi:hypothetical protein
MGKMKCRRQRESDRRTGRAWAAKVATRSESRVGPPAAAAYDGLTARLVRLREALAGDRFAIRALSDVQHDQADLEHSPGDAVARAFAADAAGSVRPEGVMSWAAEGLARSYERELVLLDATEKAQWPTSASDVPTFARLNGY